MSSNIAFTLPFTVGGSKNVDNYFSCDGSIETNTKSTWAGDCILRWTKTSEKYATLNAQGMNELFPNSIAKPISGYMSASIARTGLSGTSTIYGIINGTKVLTCTSKSNKYALNSANINASTLATISKSSTFIFSGTSSTSVNQTAASSVEISLTFVRYDFTASAGTAIASASVSSSTGYDGDKITYNCVLNDGATFDGWYYGTTKVSSSQTYTHTVNGADVTLTAKAIAGVTRTVTLTYNGSTVPIFSTAGSVQIKYNTVIATLNGGDSKRLKCNGKYMDYDIYIKTKKLTCKDKTMKSDIVVSYS